MNQHLKKMVVSTLNNKKNCQLQYRIFKDCSYYERWVKGFVAVWGEWHDYKYPDTLDNISELKDKAEARKRVLKYKTEFRIIKTD